MDGRVPGRPARSRCGPGPRSLQSGDPVRHEDMVCEGRPAQNSVNGIVQTPDGYLWFATEEGLARFDGAQFTIFDSNNRSVPHRYVTALTPDAKGGLWIGTLSGGFTHYL